VHHPQRGGTQTAGRWLGSVPAVKPGCSKRQAGKRAQVAYKAVQWCQVQLPWHPRTGRQADRQAGQQSEGEDPGGGRHLQVVGGTICRSAAGIPAAEQAAGEGRQAGRQARGSQAVAGGRPPSVYFVAWQAGSSIRPGRR